jgi:hypothetical protein
MSNLIKQSYTHPNNYNIPEKSIEIPVFHLQHKIGMHKNNFLGKLVHEMKTYCLDFVSFIMKCFLSSYSVQIKLE